MKKYASHLLIFALMLLFCSYSIIPALASGEKPSCTTSTNTEDTRFTSPESFQKVIFIVRDDDNRISLSLKDILFHLISTCRLLPIKVEAVCREYLYTQSSILLDRSYAFHLLGVLKSRAHPPTF